MSRPKAWPERVGALRFLVCLTATEALYECSCGRECRRSYATVKSAAAQGINSSCKKCVSKKRVLPNASWGRQTLANVVPSTPKESS